MDFASNRDVIFVIIALVYVRMKHTFQTRCIHCEVESLAGKASVGDHFASGLDRPDQNPSVL